MHVQSKNSIDCCGCSACANACPKDAISMKPDEMGFRYPVVDEDKCIDCGLCDKVCDFNSNYKRDHMFEHPLVYGCRHKNISELEYSQSGALSFALAEVFINDGGVVYGAMLKGSSEVIHRRCVSIDDLQTIRYSKYIQSNPQDSFKEVKLSLAKGEKVLYFGTPCQIAGLKSYIGKQNREMLWTADLVCHAVPSPQIWKDYVEYISKKYKIEPEETRFRNKKYGWHSHFESFRGGKRFLKKKTFRELFYFHLVVRPSCSNCPYTNYSRVGDVTCGDFWGWEKAHKVWNDNKGVSLALINSEKGQNLFESANLSYIESSEDECLQPQLRGPIELHPLYKSFVQDYKRNGFLYVAEKYSDLGWRYYVNAIKCFVAKFSGYLFVKSLLNR